MELFAAILMMSIGLLHLVFSQPLNRFYSEGYRRFGLWNPVIPENWTSQVYGGVLVAVAVINLLLST